MPLQVNEVRERQADLVTEYEGEEIQLTYRLGEISPELLDGLSIEPVRTTLSKILVTWDVENRGEPYQPTSEDARPYWEERVRAQRVELLLAERNQQLAQERVTRRRQRKPTKAQQVVSDTEIANLREEPVDDAAIRQAYVDEWERLLKVLPQPLLDQVLQAILDDMVGGLKPSEDSDAG